MKGVLAATRSSATLWGANGGRGFSTRGCLARGTETVAVAPGAAPE